MADVNTTLFNVNSSVEMLQEMGLFNYILPVGIFFLILFGVLDQYKIISKDKKVNALVSLLISMFIMLYAYTNEIEWFFAMFYTKMSIALIILLFALTLAVFVFKGLSQNGMIPKGKEKIWNAGLIIMSVMIVNAAFANAPGEIGVWAAETSGVALSMGILAAILSAFISKGETTEEKE